MKSDGIDETIAEISWLGRRINDVLQKLQPVYMSIDEVTAVSLYADELLPACLPSCQDFSVRLNYNQRQQ